MRWRWQWRWDLLGKVQTSEAKKPRKTPYRISGGFGCEIPWTLEKLILRER
jgi:hypothetical protein